MRYQAHIPKRQFFLFLKVAVFSFFSGISISCSGVSGDKKVFTTHLKSFIDTFYVWAMFSVLFPSFPAKQIHAVFTSPRRFAIIALHETGGIFMLRTLTYRILSATGRADHSALFKSLGYSGPILVHLKKKDHGTLLERRVGAYE